MMTTIHHTLDTQGLICPEPVMLLHKAVRTALAGEIIEVLATDSATTRDIPNFCLIWGMNSLINKTSLTQAKPRSPTLTPMSIIIG